VHNILFALFTIKQREFFQASQATLLTDLISRKSSLKIQTELILNVSVAGLSTLKVNNTALK